MISVMFTTYANNNVTCDRPKQNNFTKKIMKAKWSMSR